ncbi:AMP-binding protein [Rhodococcus sp. BP-316]|uniref:AMP-binding protein n=1 Tax=Rhodococcus sp. BP-316 TaxID=2739445 RepID=UPI001C9A67CC|nr:AMP-binding protein [Rhodococcus sp. BP-316]MBY6682302.1 AMP-binding protein [Rhodococcus sp. BP-316]
MQPTRLPADELVREYRARGHWSDDTVGSLLTRCAAARPDALAVVDGDRRSTFGDIERDASRLALSLQRLGVSRDSVVSFQLPNCVEAVIVFHAVMKLGAVANPIVPIYREQEVSFILDQSGAAVVFVMDSRGNRDVESMYSSPIFAAVDVVVVGSARWNDMITVTDVEVEVEGVGVDPDDVCLLLYTSGTTAEPKGVLHSHNTLVFENRSMVDWFGLGPDDVVFNPSPVTHVTGINCALTLPFLLGIPVVLQDRWDSDVALARILAERASFMIFSTPFLRGLVNAATRANTSTPSVRYVVCGGADIPDSLATAATDTLGTTVRMFGATEGPSATCSTTSDSLHTRTRSDGRPIAPTDVLVDGTDRSSSVGEILWRGPDTFLGYLDASLNEAAFTQDGFFRTGDLGRFDDDGYLHVVGRIKDIINRSGEKISAYSVESLLSQHPHVSEVAIVAGPDPVTGERGCAFVVPEAGTSIDLAEVQAFLESHKIARQRFPESVFVVDSLPKTPSGKIQKFALREWTRDRAEVPRHMAGITIAASYEVDR